MKYFVGIFVLGSFLFFASAGEIKDSESASHDNTAAQYQIVDTYTYPDFELVQFTLAVLSHYSYILVSGDEALVVDPGRDVSVYLDYCREHDLKIKGVFLSHSHADFVAGHSEMAKVPGVTIYSGINSGAKFQHKPIKEGSVIKIGSASLEVMETPGHTPDGLCGLVSSKDGTPRLILTGDTLFIGSVGRPDLMGGTMTAASLASMAFDTWHNKLSKLADTVAIFPAHGAGSLCGAHLSDAPTSTIGEQRTANPYLKYTNRNEFITAVLEGLPEAPQYFKHNAAMNKNGPPLVSWDEPLNSKEPDKSITDPKAFYVVDLRNSKAYASAHIPNSVNIALRGRIETWVGTMVPWGSNLILVGNEEELKEGVKRLHRVGYSGHTIPWNTWTKSGLPTAKNKRVSPKALYASMKRGDSPIIVDVRLPNEWMGLRIGNVVNMPLNKLAEQSSKLNPNDPVVAVCNSAFRSSLAVGILERNGFTKASSLDGGSQAWIEAGYPTYSTQMVKSLTPPSVEGKPVRLPERISAADLQRLLVDLPGSYDIVDIRPASAFADYRLPHSVNVHVSDLISHTEFLDGPKPLVIVDRDGTLAMAAGGVLSQKSDRKILVLYGGLTDYWRESDFPPSAHSVPASSTTPSPTSESPPPIIPRTEQAPKPKPKKKVSAGC